MEFKHSFLQDYMEFVEDTESPRVFHLFSAISGVAATLGRRCFLPFGMSQIFPNMYVTLVGPPAVRKSTAINIMKSLIQQGTGVKFGPDDTAGQRQGLISSLAGDVINQEDTEENDALKQVIRNISSPDALKMLDEMEVNPVDEHCVYVCASELATFWGINSREMITFLTKMWDGEDHEYKIRHEKIWLKDPLLSILGGTTPATIAESLPSSATGGGFMSRNILVFANKKHKSIPFPSHASELQKQKLLDTIRFIYSKLTGQFSFGKNAKAAATELYKYQVKINDPRFVYYIERRFTHLLKVAMALAGMRRSMEISAEDIEQAQLVLSSTEDFMVDALGEFGLSPLGAAKQKMLEFIENSSPAPVPLATLIAVMKRDMKQVDLMNSLMDLCNANKVQQVTTRFGDAYVSYNKNDKIKTAISAMALDSISEPEEEAAE